MATASKQAEEDEENLALLQSSLYLSPSSRLDGEQIFPIVAVCLPPTGTGAVCLQSVAGPSWLAGQRGEMK